MCQKWLGSFLVKKVLINCSNLHSGGGVAVASSFLDCATSQLGEFPSEMHVLVSKEVEKNLVKLGTNVQSFDSYEVIDFFGISALWNGLGSRLKGYDVIFTIFGPSYDLRFGGVHIVGFAQPNIIYPYYSTACKGGFIARAYLRVKYLVQGLFFLKASALVVELEHVERGLRKKGFFKEKDIFIIESAVHRVYSNRSDWIDMDWDLNTFGTLGQYKLGIISRNYAHKNLMLLPRIKKILWDKYKLAASFYVTFTEEEWQVCDDEFKSNIVNVGGLDLAQCPSFYEKMDGVIFPSLLECFSAVPIEAMSLGIPVFASDRDFIHDVCGSYVEYFDPLDENSIASSIYEFFALPERVRAERVSAARHYVERFVNADERSLKYLDLIRSYFNP